MAAAKTELRERLRETSERCREEINGRPLTAYFPLTRSRGNLMYNCPVCGSGTGRNHTGALRLYAPGESRTGKWHVICFANRCFGENGTDTLGALRVLHPELSEWELFRKLGLQALSGGGAGERPAARTRDAEAPDEAERRQLRQRISRWTAALPGSPGEAYLRSRGLTEETIREAGLGYDPEHWFGSLGHRAPAVIIPYPGADYYAARAIGEKAFDKPRTKEAGPEPLFNAAALRGGQPVYVVESQLCALSIRQSGGEAVALGNTGGARLLEALRREPPAQPLLLSLDNDPQQDPAVPEKGPRAQAELAEALRAAGIPFLEFNVAGAAKDPNEALQADPEELRRRVRDGRAQAAAWMAEQKRREERAAEEAAAQAALAREARQEEYLRTSAAGMMPAFYLEIEKNRSHPPVPTGFPGLDRLLDGGLYPGLYVVGAVTSLGKTSFALQMVDQIAAQGTDVLFFSLEMSRFELMAKSVSRLTWTLTQGAGKDRFCAKTTRGILAGKRYERYQEAELETIRLAQEEYSGLASHLWLIEGVGDVSTQMIRQCVDRHLEMTGRPPVVVVDYLQIMTPVDIRATDKQNTDRNVLEMKRLSRDKNIPVIGISSLNRENYLQPINLAAFKEAGSIEYGSDCLLGLQYEGMDYREGEADKAREKRIREMMRENENLAKDGKPIQIQLKVLKNRNGARGVSAPLLYRPMFNHFEELPQGYSPAGGDPFRGAAAVPLRGKG